MNLHGVTPRRHLARRAGNGCFAGMGCWLSRNKVSAHPPTPIKRSRRREQKQTPSFLARPRPHSDLADPPLVLTTPSHTHNRASSSDILLTLECVHVCTSMCVHVSAHIRHRHRTVADTSCTRSSSCSAVQFVVVVVIVKWLTISRVHPPYPPHTHLNGQNGKRNDDEVIRGAQGKGVPEG